MHRPAYLAGSWYPHDATECRQAIEQHAAGATLKTGTWRGAILPHAGWLYSGDAAAQTLAILAHNHPNPEVLIVLGSHRSAVGPNTLLMGDGWESPLGTLATHLSLTKDIHTTVGPSAELHEEPLTPRRPDNAVEVLIPMLKFFFPQAQLIMMGLQAAPQALDVGDAVAHRLERSGVDALVVASTDLTHYGPNYQFEPHGPGHHGRDWVRQVNDQGFIDRVLAWQPLDMVDHARTEHSACCPGAVAAGMAMVQRLTQDEPQPHLVTHYLSSDIRPSSSFVGYAGILL